MSLHFLGHGGPIHGAWPSSRDDTIALMAFKLAKGKAKTAARPQGGLPCVVFLILAMFLVMFILYYAMSQHANT